MSNTVGDDHATLKYTLRHALMLADQLGLDMVAIHIDEALAQIAHDEVGAMSNLTIITPHATLG